MFVCVLANVLFLATLFATYPYFAFIPIICYFLLLVTISWNYKYEVGMDKLILGIVTSIFAPCLILKDNAYYFFKNGIAGNVMSIWIIWFMYFFTTIDAPWIQSLTTATIFECSPHINSSDLNMDLVYRCTSTNFTSLDTCHPGIISLHDQFSNTICPLDYGKWWIFLMLCIMLSVLKVISVLNIYLIDYFSDPINKLKFGRKFCNCVFWKEEDMFWYEYACDFADGKPFEEVNDRAEIEIDQSLLLLSIRSDFIGFTEVCMYYTYRGVVNKQIPNISNYVDLCTEADI